MEEGVLEGDADLAGAGAAAGSARVAEDGASASAYATNEAHLPGRYVYTEPHTLHPFANHPPRKCCILLLCMHMRAFTRMGSASLRESAL